MKKHKMPEEVADALGLTGKKKRVATGQAPKDARIKGYAWTCADCGSARFLLASSAEALEALDTHDRTKRHAERHSRSGVFPHDRSGNPIHL